jgi:glycolate oxidase FAD binding subunit
MLGSLAEFAVRPYAVFRMRASVPPQAVGDLCRMCAANGEQWQIHVHAGNGVVHIQGNVDQGKIRLSEFLSAVQGFASERGGNVVVEECPPEWKAGLSIWGMARDDFWLMHRIKNQLDPDNIFNPGRFVDGI